MGVFIRFDIDPDKLSATDAEMLAGLCPVDIFLLEDAELKVNLEQEDECILCDLCLERSPVGAITIHKLYKDEKLVSWGSSSPKR